MNELWKAAGAAAWGAAACSGLPPFLGEAVWAELAPKLEALCPGAKTILVGAFPYYAGDTPGNLSLYCRGEDYHLVLGRRLQTVVDALAITGDARKAILDEIMLPCISAPRAEVSKYAPKMITMKIDPDKIREVIGKGGSVIQKITAESGAQIDIEDDGTIHIASPDAACCDIAKKMIDTIVFVPEVGMLYYGKVVRILNFGAFVELAPGKDGMVHISKLAERRVEKVEDVVHVGDMVWVKVTDIDEKGRVNLSLRDAQREIAAMEARDAKKHNN